MGKRSAGVLLFRLAERQPEVVLVHPGGPLWRNKDLGAWSIPKGEYDFAEDPRQAALRELHEEIGVTVDADTLIDLGEITQKSGKIVSAWAGETDVAVSASNSNTFELEWPPRSGQHQTFPEVDRAEWFDTATARDKLNPAQQTLIDRLIDELRQAGRMNK